jgi:hypothetical protein
MTKKHLLLSLLLIPAFILSGCTSEDKEQVPAIPTPVPTVATTISPDDIIDVSLTDQFSLPQGMYGNFATNGITETEPTYLMPAFYTADQYIQKSFNSRYLYSGAWGKSDYTSKWAEENKVLDLLSSEYKTTFVEMNNQVISTKDRNLLNNLVYTPSPDYQVLPNCDRKAAKEYCSFLDLTIVDANFIYNSDEDITLNISIQINPIYQKPDAPEGSTVYQTQQYNLQFKLSYENPPTEVSPKKPIVIINNISSNLEIKGTTDLGTNQTAP